MNVPKLRFKEFNDEWKEQKFKEFTYYSGKRNKENLNLVSYAITNNFGFIPQSLAHNEFGYMKNTDKRAYNIVTPFSFAYNPARINVGSIGYYNGKKNIIVSSLYEVFKTKEYIDDKFLWYWLKSDIFPIWINRLQEGSVRQYFYYDKLCEVSLYYPTFIEQTKIAQFLLLLDKKIELQVKKIEALKLFKKGLNQRMFSKIGKMKSISQYVEEYINKTIVNNQYPILSSTFNGIVIQNEYFNKQAASSKNIGYKIVPRNYITYRSMSDTGEFHFNIQDKVDIGIVSPAYPVFRINNINANYFLNYINESYDFKMQIISIKEGGTRYALGFNKFKKLKIKIIDDDEFYGDFIKKLNEYLLLEDKKLDDLNKLKKGLLQNMFV